MTGVLAIVAGLLQVVVPSYALRLVHRFGAKRVGWFVVTAFSTLALLHLLVPLRPSGSTSGMALDIVFAVGSVLLLIGMGHVETLVKERDQAHSNEESLRLFWSSKTDEKTHQLARTNEKLLEEIARREASEKALAVSEAYYRFLFSQNPQPMWIFDLRSCNMIAANGSALRLYGFDQEEFGRLTVWDLLPAEANAYFEKTLGSVCSSPVFLGLSQHCCKDRSLVDVEMTALDFDYGDIRARLILASEITHRRRQELETRKVQKMEAIGHITAGVAQHFNSILSVIETNAALLAPELKDPRTAERLKNISGAANLGSGLTNKLLAVGAKRSLQMEVIDLNGLISNMNGMLGRLVGEEIDLKHTYGSRLTPILADPRIVEEIIINLVSNARDAMSRSGDIEISTSAAVVNNVDGNGGSKVGQFVCLSVRDDGPGMTPEVQSAVFQPFFTTGNSSQAFGLGLASIYGLVRQHSGWVEFESKVGVGTTFKIFLPCAPAAAILAQSESKKIKPKSKGKGTVMLVEPDDRVRSMARFVLDQHGYQVIEADCGSIALLLWEGRGMNVNLLLTDISLPGDITGCELAKRLQESRPSLKVIFTSSSQPDDKSLKFIPKPYRPDRLLKEVESFAGDNSVPVVC